MLLISQLLWFGRLGFLKFHLSCQFLDIFIIIEYTECKLFFFADRHSQVLLNCKRLGLHQQNKLNHIYYIHIFLYCLEIPLLQIHPIPASPKYYYK